ncbi:unnamed protein product [Cunninghamella blakesleeana]
MSITHKYNTRSKTKVLLPPTPPPEQQISSTGETINNTTNSNNKGKRRIQSEQPKKVIKKKKVNKKTKAPLSSTTSTSNNIINNHNSDNNNNNTKDGNRLASLPPEILMCILSNLAIHDLYHLSLSNKKIYGIVRYQSIWADILVKNGKRTYSSKDNMLSVLKNGSKVCDECHIYAKPSGYNGAILTTVNTKKNEKRQLCLDCRRRHYAKHPENILNIVKAEFPDVIDDNEQDINNIERKLTKSTAKSVLRLNDGDLLSINHIMARNPYGRSFAPMYLYNLPELITTTICKHGGYVGLLAERERSKKVCEKREETIRIKEEAHRRESDARKAILVDKLHAAGLTLRPDSSLCERFIERGIGKPDDIVVCMIEMKWYYENTNYSSNISNLYEMMYDNDDDFDYFNGRRRMWYRIDELYDEEKRKIELSNSAKTQTLRQWVAKRTQQNKFQRPENDVDDAKRPPSSLWKKINNIFKEEIVSIGLKYLSEDVKSNPLYFNQKCRLSEGTMGIIKNDLKDKVIPNIQLSSGIVNTFGALVLDFYNEDHESNCYYSIARKLKVVQ